MSVVDFDRFIDVRFYYRKPVAVFHNSFTGQIVRMNLEQVKNKREQIIRGLKAGVEDSMTQSKLEQEIHQYSKALNKLKELML